jgi:hypothetical protein
MTGNIKVKISFILYLIINTNMNKVYYKSALDFLNNKEHTDVDLVYVLTNFKRKGYPGTVNLIDLYKTKRIPFDLNILKLTDKFKELQKVILEDKIIVNPYIKNTQVLFGKYDYEGMIKVTYVENPNNWLTINELSMIDDRSVVLFEANSYITTKEEYQLIYILTKDILIITNDDNRKEWIISILA